jgi:GT2 family glycosyltransferase
MSVAIVVPSLNQRRFLVDALDSIGATTVAVYRAVLDGGSTDGSRELIEARAAQLDFWRSAPDEGQAAAINEGIARLCRAHPGSVDAVGWLNADDYFLEHGLDSLWQALADHPEWVAVSARGLLVDEAGRPIGEVPTEPFVINRFARACTICQPATLMRRSAWERAGGLDGSLEMCFDYDLWWRLSEFGPIGYIDRLVAAARDHHETKTRRRRRQYFREATAIVKRETGAVPWHWYVSEAIERRVNYAVGVRPPLITRLQARLEALPAYVRGSVDWFAD